MNELVTGLMPGLNTMANVHPLLVHFPIALFFCYVLAEALALLTRRESLRQAASWMLYFGTLGAAATVVTGLLAAGMVEHDEAVHALMERHEQYGIAVLASAVGLSLWRGWRGGRFSPWGSAIHFGGAVTLAVLVTLGADLGGMMVYGHAVGVATPPAAAVVEMPAPTPDAGAAAVSPAPPPEASAPAGDKAGSHRHAHPHTHKHAH